MSARFDMLITDDMCKEPPSFSTWEQAWDKWLHDDNRIRQGVAVQRWRHLNKPDPKEPKP